MDPTSPAPADHTVRVRGARFQGSPIDGNYPFIRMDGDVVVIQHPQHGRLRLRRAQVEGLIPQVEGLPGAQPAAAPASAYDALVADIRSRFVVLNKLMDGIVDGRIRSLIVSGAPGVGKTHTVETRLAAARKAGKIRKFTTISGTMSPIAMYMLLYQHRLAGSVVVLDDCDTILFDEEGVNILKAATDTGKVRTISYMKEAPQLTNAGVPKSFDFAGCLVYATNVDFEREISHGSKHSKHLEALINRALYLDLGLHTKEALMARVEDVCRTTSMLRDEGIDTAQTEALIAWMHLHRERIRSLSLRTAMSLASLILTHPTEWDEMARGTLLRAAR